MNIPSGVQLALITAIVLLILVYWFRDRVSEIVFGKARITLFRPSEIQQTVEAAQQAAQEEQLAEEVVEGVQWHKVATLFWLGNDLMWITDMIYRGAPPARVLQGIDHARQYLIDLGFKEGKFPHQQLDLARTVLGSLDGLDTSNPRNAELLKQHYRTVAKEIQTIKWYISALAEGQEPGFRKLRAL